MSRPPFLQDDAKLHNLCQEGNLTKIKKYVENLTDEELVEKLANRKGMFGYTPLHEAVARGKADVLDYLLSRTKNAHVNCRANSGYTPLHLAASSGHKDCVIILLKHNANISIMDEFGKTPIQTAELGAKASIVRLLRSEGERVLLSASLHVWVPKLLNISIGKVSSSFTISSFLVTIIFSVVQIIHKNNETIIPDTSHCFLFHFYFAILLSPF